jgi:hypothetical protein
MVMPQRFAMTLILPGRIGEVHHQGVGMITDAGMFLN